MAAVPALAEEEKKAPGKAWTDEAELAYVQTDGNSEMTSFSAKNKLTYQFNPQIKAAWSISALYGESDDKRTAEQYATDLKVDYSLSSRLYTGGLIGWQRDTFAGIEHRYYIGPIAGYHIFTGPKHFLVTEAGINYVNEEYTDDTDDTYAQARAFGSYEYVFDKKTKAFQTAEFLQSLDEAKQYRVNSETGIITALSDQFSLKVSYIINYNNAPIPESLEKTDTKLAATLLVSF